MTFKLISRSSSLLCTFALFLLATAVVAQPPKRRTQQAETQAKATQTQKAAISYREFPAAQQMPEDAEWRRDVYRELDLTLDANAPLYYPPLPQGNRMSLFTYIFKLIMRGQVKAYDCNLQGTEDFSAGNVLKITKILADNQINHEIKDKRLHLADEDIPSQEVLSYYIKESTYYDQHTATFHSYVSALCPVLHRTDQYGQPGKYLMFWVKYEDLAPYLGKLMLMYSNLNNAALMSAADYFTQNLYKGNIYYATNLQDKLLVTPAEEYDFGDDPDTDTMGLAPKVDSTLIRQRNIIEKQLTDFEKHVWRGDTVERKPQAEATDTAAVADEKATVRRTSRIGRRGTTVRSGSTSKPTKQKTKTQKPSARRSGSGSGFSVRRQRH